MERSPIEVFFSYSREDKPLRDKLEKHLISLKRQGVISLWHDRQIVAGSEWEEEIDRHMRTADIILLLVSPDFVNSKYCYDIELPDAMARHDAGEAYVVPILLRPVAGWKRLPFAKLQVYPSGAVPITQWADQDTAFVDVVEGIETAVEKLLTQRQEQLKAEEQWRKEHVGESESFFNSGWDKWNKGDNKGAIADYNQAIKLNPDFAAAYNNRGIARRALGGKKAAIADYDQAIKLKSDFADAYYNRGNVRSDLGDNKGAIADYGKAIEINKNWGGFSDNYYGLPTAYMNRGIARSELGDQQAAIADYDQAIKLNPDYADAYNNRGIARSNLGDKQAAIADYDQAIKLNPDFAKAYNNRGIARSDLGDKQAAIADYDQALKLNPDYADAYYNRGNARTALGNKPGAIADFQKAADLYQKQGNDKWRQEALNRLKELQS